MVNLDHPTKAQAISFFRAYDAITDHSIGWVLMRTRVDRFTAWTILDDEWIVVTHEFGLYTDMMTVSENVLHSLPARIKGYRWLDRGQLRRNPPGNSPALYKQW